MATRALIFISLLVFLSINLGTALPPQPSKIVKTVSGDEYVCVDINKQPALNHPSLKHHKVEMEFVTQNKRDLQREGLYDKYHQNIWLDKGCPETTVPIRRETGFSLQQMGQKPGFSNRKTLDRAQYTNFAGVRLKSRFGDVYHGTEAYIDTYNPKISNEMRSHAVIGVGTDSYATSIQVGWMVYPMGNRDERTRLFNSITAEDATCYNCGFVAVNSEIPSDLELSDVSQMEGQQFDNLYGLIFRPSTGSWYFYLHHPKNIIGYWAKEFLTGRYAGLSEGASATWWGGLVASPYEERTPKMGSGVFQNGRYDTTCYVRNAKLLLSNGIAIDVKEDNPRTILSRQDSKCYYAGDNFFKYDPYWGYRFVFGGTGGKAHNDCVY